MTNPKRKSKHRRLRPQLPPGPVSSGLARRTAQRHARRALFLSFGPLSIAFDELHDHFRLLAQTPNLNMELSHLLEEAQDLIISGVDRALFEDKSPLEESRKLLELELLLNDFAAAPENINEWASAKPWERQRKFGFGELRKREEKRLGLPEDQVLATRDHWTHHSLHSHPKPISDDRAYPNEKTAMYTHLADLMNHALSALQSAESCVIATGLCLPKDYEQLSIRAIHLSRRQVHTDFYSGAPPELVKTFFEPRPKKQG